MYLSSAQIKKSLLDTGKNCHIAFMNWKIVVGVLLIIGASKEMISIIIDYRSGKLNFWPLGADIACIGMIALGIYLIRKGQKQKKQL
jgi:hypothetical protein